MSADEQLVKAIRTGLAELADPVKATAMQAYMKSAMPFRGVASPERSAFLKGVLADHIVPDRVKYSATVLELWRTAEFREERYAAIALSGHRAYRQWQDPDLVPMYEEMIVSGAWWDYVDELAIRRIGPILRSHRPELTRLMLRWAADHDLWRRRTAIICQVGAKEETDTDLLVRAIEPAIAEPEFFLRKGIGWALREYAKTSPDWVRSFVTVRALAAGGAEAHRVIRGRLVREGSTRVIEWSTRVIGGPTRGVAPVRRTRGFQAAEA